MAAGEDGSCLVIGSKTASLVVAVSYPHL